MEEEELITHLTNLLMAQQALSVAPSPQQRICGDLGVCGDDFQDFMSAVWIEFQLPSDGKVILDFPEENITLIDVAAIVRLHGQYNNSLI